MRPLKRERVVRDMSQDELARRAGLTRQVISNLERGASHGYPETWRKIAGVLGVSVDELLAEPTDPKGQAPRPWRDQLRALDKTQKRDFALTAKGLVSDTWLGAMSTREIRALNEFTERHGVSAEDVLMELIKESPGLSEALDQLAVRFDRESRKAVDEALEHEEDASRAG